jgi:glutaredoxin
MGCKIGYLPGMSRGALLPFLLMALFAGTAVADTVTLKNGKKFVGEVVEDSQKSVSLKQGRVVHSFNPDNVDHIDYSREEADNARRAELPVEKPVTPAPPVVKPVHAVTPPPPPAAPPERDYQYARVTLYGTSWCGFCARARAWFTAHKVPFTDLDIEKNTEARAEVARKCVDQGQGEFSGSVPVLDVNGRLIQGFNVGEIQAALNKD